jgi:hypothetical protein
MPSCWALATDERPVERTEGTMVLAWAVWVAGLGVGLGGCALMLPPSRRMRRASWNTAIERTARETLAIARQLAAHRHEPLVAGGVTAGRLDDLAARFDALAAAIVRGEDAPAVRSDLSVAANGARAEADRLRNVIVVGSDRRAFVAALRRLRDINATASVAAGDGLPALAPSTLAG